MAKPVRSEWGPTLTAARKHILAQGEVIYAFNQLHDAFFQTFHMALILNRPETFAHNEYFDHALSIWHAVISDRQQRQMALAAIATLPVSKEEGMRRIIRRLKWAKKITDDVADYRNIAAHTPIMFRGTIKDGAVVRIPEFGGHSTRKSYWDRLKQINGDLKFWAALRDDFLKLSEYVRDVNLFAAGMNARIAHGAELVGAPDTLPDRPRLKSIRSVVRIKQALNREGARPRRRKRR
jgi:hypothetical protein